MTTPTSPAGPGHDWDWADVRKVCLREARRILGPGGGAADDAAQEAAIRAWRSRARCRTPASPYSWIAAIARNEALRMLSQRHERSLEDAGPEPACDDLEELDLVDILDLRRALRTMDGDDRQLLIGHYWQDLPNRELAEQLGVAEATVRVRLHRLRLRLRNTLVEA
jgi:RNA polymerase sigma-70 factor (ECF subfamily)